MQDYMKAYYPPPWPLIEENWEKTKGWCAFQDWMKENKEFMENCEKYELSFHKTK